MNALFEWFKGWVKDLATTPTLIVVGIVLAVVYVLWALVADTLGRPLTLNTLNTIGLFIASMITGGVTQFSVKRVTDHGYVAAKKGNGPSAPTPDAPPPRETTAVPRQPDQS